ncbi:MAG: hypothetical protein ABIV43_03130 [Candidatus Saccharimonadales bacterium]
METLYYSFGQAVGNSQPLRVGVPMTLQDTLDYSYAPLLRNISLFGGNCVSSVDTVDGTEYLIDSQRIGLSPLSARHRGLELASQLLYVVAQAASKKKLSDPEISLLPSMRPVLGKFTLSAQLQKPVHSQAALRQMQTTYHDLFDAHGDGQRTRKAVSHESDLSRLVFGVGQPAEELATVKYFPLADRHYLSGEVSSREHMLVLFAGAVALVRPPQLLGAV